MIWRAGSRPVRAGWASWADHRLAWPSGPPPSGTGGRSSPGTWWRCSSPAGTWPSTGRTPGTPGCSARCPTWTPYSISHRHDRRFVEIDSCKSRESYRRVESAKLLFAHLSKNATHSTGRSKPLTLRPFMYQVILLGGKEAPTVHTAVRLSPTLSRFLSISSTGSCLGKSMTRIGATRTAVWNRGASSETSHSKFPFKWRVTPRRVTWFWLECFGCNYL